MVLLGWVYLERLKYYLDYVIHYLVHLTYLLSQLILTSWFTYYLNWSTYYFYTVVSTGNWSTYYLYTAISTGKLIYLKSIYLKQLTLSWTVNLISQLIQLISLTDWLINSTGRDKKLCKMILQRFTHDSSYLVVSSTKACLYITHISIIMWYKYICY